MTNQAKRWTANGAAIFHDGNLVAVGDQPYGTCQANLTIASRLAACADLLREHEDLGEVVVMRREDVEKVREIGRRLRARADALKDPESYVAIHELMDSLPARPKIGEPKPARSENEGE